MNPLLKSLVLSLKKLEPAFEKLEPTLAAALPTLVEALLDKAVEKLTGAPHRDAQREETLLATLAELRADHEHLHKTVLELKERQKRTERRMRWLFVLSVTALAIGATCLVWRVRPFGAG